MKVHSANINYIIQNRYKPNKKEYDAGSKSVLSSDVIFNYLNITANYNPVFSGAKRDFYAIDKDGNYQKFSDRKAAESTLSLAKTNIAECLQGRRSATHGYAFVYADEIETTDKNGEIVIDETKLNMKIQQIKTTLKPQDKSIPIYAIDKSGNLKKYPSKYQAGKALGISVPHIISVLNKQLKKTGGYTFVLPEEIETTNANGTVVIDRRKANEIISHAFEDSNSTPIYAIHTNGSYKRFSGVRKASRELSLEPANISRCLNGGQKRVGSYTFVKAEEVETVDDKKNVSVDTEKIKKLNKETMIYENYVPVYSIASDGSLLRFENKMRAAKAFDMDISTLTHCLQGLYDVVRGHSFAYADEIETIDENGNTVINYDVLKEKYEDVNKKAVYVIYKDGHYEKYITQTEAAKELGLNRNKISACVNGLSTRVAGRMFVKAEDVESFENGNLIVNKQLLQKFACELITSGVKAVYSIDTEGNCQRYDSTSQAAQVLSLSKSGIKQCLSGQNNTSGGYKFIYAENVEEVDDKGNIVVDKQLLQKFANEFITSSVKAVYSIDTEGNCQRYNNISQSAEVLSLSKSGIMQCLSGKQKTSGGYKFIYAENVEKVDDKGNIVVDKQLLQKFANEFITSGVKAVYSFDAEGNCQRYNNISQSAEVLSLSKSGIMQCLSGKQKTSGGYRFIYAENVEKVDDKGNIVVDYDKLDEIAGQINPAIKKRMKKFGKIYVIKDVNIMEFDNIRKAARALGIDENLIVYFLENGRNPQDGKNSIRGYVFATEKDK